MAKITLKQVKKNFDKTPVIHGVDLEIQEREFVALVGPSGCGKTTLLRMIAGLEEVSSGEIYIDDHLVNFVPPARRGIAMVFQSYALYPHMTVYENMAFGLKLKRTSKEEVDSRVRSAAKTLQIERYLDRKPKQLSGGQRQRVAIGRAIVRDPKAFLFDEPLSNLDASLRVKMRMELANLKAQLKSTMIYVTHDQVEAMTLADKIVVMRDGMVEQVGHPLELYNNPCNKFVAGFIGSPQMNFIPVTVSGVAPASVTVKLDGMHDSVKVAINPASNLQVGQQLTMGIRPGHLSYGGEEGMLIKGKVVVMEYLGTESFCHVILPSGQIIIVRVDGNLRLEEDEAIELRADIAKVFLFSAEGERIYCQSQVQSKVA